MSSWDTDILDDDLDDDLEDDELSDEVEDMSLEDGGDELSSDDEQLSEAELAADYAISDQGVRALSGDRGAALDQPKLLGEVLAKSSPLEKKLSGESPIVRVVIHFANGRKLYLTP